MPFATGNDMKLRYSPVILGGLCSDTTSVISADDLPANPVMLMALKTATGRVKGQLYKSKMYTAADIDALRDVTDDDTYDNDSDQWLRDLTCRIAYMVLVDRKPWNDQHKIQYNNTKETIDNYLDQIAKGTIILNVSKTKEAGVPDSLGIDAQTSTAYWSQAPRGRFYPQRRDPVT